MEMDAAVPSKEVSGRKSFKKVVVHISGIPVEFPHQPYGTQLAFMGRVISTLDRAVRDGHCHALLESPTGTGKSLSLLCSALAWQQNHRSKAVALSRDSAPSPEALNDPLNHGGGFIPAVDPSGNLLPSPSVENGKNQKKKKMTPTIFYASRTHSQISQVVREYRKTTYRVPMAVLASRRHYCTNAFVRGNDNIDEQCKKLLKDKEDGCPEFKNYNKVKGHSSLQKGGCHEAHDIEDLVNIGQAIKGCSYFAACSMAEDAQIIFCPYSYIVNPVVRRAMDVDIKGAIIILDEAHNIEDMARDSGSVNLEEDILLELQKELGFLSSVEAMTYQPLCEMIQDILSLISQRKSTLEKHDFQHFFSSWTGENALRVLQEANISLQCFPILQDCAKKAIRGASEAEQDNAHLSGLSASTLEGLFSSLNYFFSGNGANVHDYQLALQSYVKKSADNVSGSWVNTFSLWCLNPGIVFKDIADLSLSVILTSGTLSPMNSFATELGVQFGTCLEAPHVIDVESQLWTAIISKGPNNYPLNASYKTSEGFAFQDALGTSIEEICNIVPGGALIFFPSYKLMEKLCNRWCETGQWSRLNTRKSLFVEPRGGSQNDFDSILKDYYNSICGLTKKPISGRKRRGNKLVVNKPKSRESSEGFNKGAAFLAVCRGKVSEGIDFSDENARVVIIVGIPFPNINDVQVALKKKFNDTYKSSKNLLSGSEWYCHQAFRALNQAAGRCIRHQFDYGAIIFLDERFCEERNTRYISKWLRKSVRHYDSFNKSLKELNSFFSTVKEKLGNDANDLRNLDVVMGSIPAERKELKSHKISVRNKSSKKVESKTDMGIGKTDPPLQFPSPLNTYFLSTGTKAKIQDLELNEKATDSIAECIDVESDYEDDCRYSAAPSLIYSTDDPELSIVKETPDKNDRPVTTPESFSKNGSCLSRSKASVALLDQSFCSATLLDSSVSPESCLVVKTPQTNVTAKMNGLVFETQPPFDLSVNSISQKRRKPLNSSLVHNLNAEFDESKSMTSDHGSFATSSTSAIDENHKTGFRYEGFVSDNEFKKPISQAVFVSNGNGNAMCTPYGQLMDKRLQIACTMCRTPLGCSENSPYVMCSTTSSSKHHLVSLLKKVSEPLASSTSSIPILVCDKASVNQKIWRNFESDAGEGVWSKQDGCVFNTVLCPFCSNSTNCLGVLVVATDASNIHLLDKIMFYRDRLKILNQEASNTTDLLPCSRLCAGKTSIEKFSYSPNNQNSGGWRSTKSKIQLPTGPQSSTPSR